MCECCDFCDVIVFDVVVMVGQYGDVVDVDIVCSFWQLFEKIVEWWNVMQYLGMCELVVDDDVIFCYQYVVVGWIELYFFQ